MRNMIVVGLICFTLSYVVVGQETPKVEVFAGYSLLRSGGINLNGWNGAFTANLNSWAGMTADFSGQYVNRIIDLGVPVRDTIHVHNFMFGPHFAYRRERYTPFAHALFGVSHESLAASFVTPQPGSILNTPGFAVNGFMMVLAAAWISDWLVLLPSGRCRSSMASIAFLAETITTFAMPLAWSSVLGGNRENAS